MAEFKINEIDNYGGQGGHGFFSLKDDKDVARVRFLYNTIDDVLGYAVHEVEVDGRKRYVNCLRTYQQPVSHCPLCEAGMHVIAKIFILLYDEDEQMIKVWDRGKTFYSKISSLAARYNPLVSTWFEIERNGKRGDMKTTYEIYPGETDGTQIEDLGELPEIVGGLVLDKTFEELGFYLQNGFFESEVEQVAQVAAARSGRAVPATPPVQQAQPQQRFKARTAPAPRNRTDKF